MMGFFKYFIFISIVFFWSLGFDYKPYFSKDYCDKVIDKKYYQVCYNYSFKGAKAVYLKIDGKLAGEYIKQRGIFKEEENILNKFRSTLEDYKGSGYDRGHMASDASFDYSKDARDSTYSLVNVVPQKPYFNRHIWVMVENYSRKKAEYYGFVKVLNLIFYAKKPKTIGVNKIAVPQKFIKILWNKKEDYEECFEYENKKDKKDKVHKIECNSIKK